MTSGAARDGIQTGGRIVDRGVHEDRIGNGRSQPIAETTTTGTPLAGAHTVARKGMIGIGTAECAADLTDTPFSNGDFCRMVGCVGAMPPLPGQQDAA